MPRIMRGISDRGLSFERLQYPLIVLLLLLAVLIVLSQANPLTTRLGRDSGMYAYVGSHLLQGKSPYLTAWEHKPPAIFFIDAAGLWFGGGTRWGIWAVEFIFLLATSLTAFEALKRFFGVWPALLGLPALAAGFEPGAGRRQLHRRVFAAVQLRGVAALQPPAARPRILSGCTHPWASFLACSVLTRPNNAGVPLTIILTELLLVP